MNQRERDNDRVDAYLARLPTALPDPGHVESVLDLHLRRRRWRTRLPPALAAAAVMAWLAWGPLRTVEVSAPGPDPSNTAAWAELRSADRRLQAAYRVGANEGRLARLWETRRDAAEQVETDALATRRVRL